MRALRWLFAWLQLAGVALGIWCHGPDGAASLLVFVWFVRSERLPGEGGTVRQWKRGFRIARTCRVGGTTSPPLGGLHLQRELTFVLFIARVFIVISD